MKKIAIIGGGDLGKQFAHLILSDKKVKVVGFFDDFLEEGLVVNNIPVLGDLEQIGRLFHLGVFDELICAIGYKYLKFKQSFCDELELKGIPFYTHVHGSVILDSTSEILPGCVIYPGAIIDQNVKIGKHTIINLGAIISHDTTIGRSCFISPNVSIAGFCNIGDYCILGISSTIIDNISLGRSVQLGAGGLIINNINDAGLYVGSPCRKIR